MNKCTWCGKQYQEDLPCCPLDGQALESTEPAVLEKHEEHPMIVRESYYPRTTGTNERIDTSLAPSCLDLEGVQGVFKYEEGFSRPDWNLIRTRIEQTVAEQDQSAAWTDAVLFWLQQLRHELGGDYHVRGQGEFVLLSGLEPARADALLVFANQRLREIYQWLGEAAWQWGNGKHVILLFADQENYYQYVAYYYREGVHPATGGCLIHRDYVHVALWYGTGHIRGTLVHELVHNAVVHLPLPLWLNEGLAVTFARGAGELQRHVLDGDLREKHFAFWNPTTIQQFWAGVTFRSAGDPSHLSYSLSEILLHLLAEGSKRIPAFIAAAQREDAGQAAAKDILGLDLGEVAATFLGPGDWSPDPEAIAQARQAAKHPEP